MSMFDRLKVVGPSYREDETEQQTDLFEGVITAGSGPQRLDKALPPVSRHIVGPDRSAFDVALKALTSGSKLVDHNGTPVIDTKDALIAPASLFKDVNKQRERVEAMVDYAVKKFPGQPLRLDGSERFVGMALDAALARGLTVEVPEKHKQLLLQKEKQLGVGAGQTPKRFIPEDDVQAGRTTTGKLVGFSLDTGPDGRRQITIQRAGQDVAVWLPDSKVDDLKPLLGKPVRYEPPTADHPARLVSLEQQKKRDAGLEIQR